MLILWDFTFLTVASIRTSSTDFAFILGRGSVPQSDIVSIPWKKHLGKGDTSSLQNAYLIKIPTFIILSSLIFLCSFNLTVALVTPSPVGFSTMNMGLCYQGLQGTFTPPDPFTQKALDPQNITKPRDLDPFVSFIFIVSLLPKGIAGQVSQCSFCLLAFLISPNCGKLRNLFGAF